MAESRSPSTAVGEERVFHAVAEEGGQRVDQWLARRLHPAWSRAAVQRFMAEGRVRVNGRSPKARDKVRAGDVATVGLPPPGPASPVPEPRPLTILFEDGHLLVVNKPAGMPVHPVTAAGRGTLVNALLAHTSLSTVGGATRPGIVHRLDQDTSGVLVVAKTDEAHRALAAQLKARAISRRYLAVVRGQVPYDEGVIEAPIGRDPRRRERMAVRSDGGRPAVSRYRVLERCPRMTVLEVRPETGRTHQIRVHLAHLGYPVVGDRQYGSPGFCERQALHAAEVTFTHPVTGIPVTCAAPLPPDLEALLAGARAGEGARPKRTRRTTEGS